MGEGNFVQWSKEGAVGVLTLNRPDKRNALSLALLEEIRTLLDRFTHDESLKVVIIRGMGPVFSAGHDLRELLDEQGDLLHTARRLFRVCSEVMEAIHRIPQPVIAQVHGIATAAGCQLVAACDLAVAASDTRFATPGVKIGLFCTTPMVPLMRTIGRRRAMEMLMTGRFVSAQEALSWGLVNKVVPPESLERETRALAEEIAQYSRLTLEIGKKAFYDQADLDEHTAYRYAQEVIAMHCTTYDAQEGIRAFLEKRSPRWCNR